RQYQLPLGIFLRGHRVRPEEAGVVAPIHTLVEGVLDLELPHAVVHLDRTPVPADLPNEPERLVAPAKDRAVRLGEKSVLLAERATRLLVQVVLLAVGTDRGLALEAGVRLPPRALQGRPLMVLDGQPQRLGVLVDFLDVQEQPRALKDLDDLPGPLADRHHVVRGPAGYFLRDPQRRRRLVRQKQSLLGRRT